MRASCTIIEWYDGGVANPSNGVSKSAVSTK